MLVGPLDAWNLPVRDVADEDMAEGELGFARDRGAALPADELLALERVQVALESGGVTAAERGGRSEPEDLPDHRGVLQHGFLAGRQRVEPRGDDAVQGLRYGDLGVAAGPRSASMRANSSA